MPRPLLCPVPQNCVGGPQPVFQRSMNRACHRDWCSLCRHCAAPCSQCSVARCAAAVCQHLSRDVCKFQPGCTVCPVVCIGGEVRSASPPTPSITCGQSEPTITFPSRLCTFALGVGASVLWPSRVVRISGWCAWCQKRSLMLAFDALGGWAGRSVSVGRAREFPAAQLARVGASVSPNAASWHAVCCQMLKCVCVRGRKFPVEEPVFICLLLLLLVISQNASSH